MGPKMQPTFKPMEMATTLPFFLSEPISILHLWIQSTGPDLMKKEIRSNGLVCSFYFTLKPGLCNNVFTDLYGLDTFGNLWHTRSKAIDGSRFTAVKTLSNGDIIVPEWETASVITLNAVKSFDVAREMSGTGHAYVVADLSSLLSTASLEAYVQDISSTSWTANPVATFDHTTPKILKRNIYYVELTVRKGGVIAPGKKINATRWTILLITNQTGLTVKITSPEFCQIDLNGWVHFYYLKVSY
jgi:hypothetical protein